MKSELGFFAGGLDENGAIIEKGLPNSGHFRVDILNMVDFGVRNNSGEEIKKINVNNTLVGKNENVEKPTHEFG